ncbi:uncharacterized protein EAE98_007628 [Botrytis deweyae]|uniref:Uncharacterized protein n=1 Tax=Botrytis deweyae TaxID=2478750 RepID=A0ABQ7IH60_9HELO|nr:uncharacterized protein EAE98_007628 [Botrytis deweyae]KAF7923810.1 hypothetical protein EAE98_007628 [Botrytis deweyae]
MQYSANHLEFLDFVPTVCTPYLYREDGAVPISRKFQRSHTGSIQPRKSRRTSVSSDRNPVTFCRKQTSESWLTCYS